MSANRKPVPIVPSIVTRMIEALAVTDRFVSWWGPHRAWPAHESARIRMHQMN